MGFGQISDMNVISDTGAINGIVIASEDADERRMTIGHSHNVWHKVVWNVVWAFSDKTGFMSPDRIEVPQRNGRERGVGICCIFHDLFDHSFSLTVWVHWLDPISLLSFLVLAINTCA